MATRQPAADQRGRTKRPNPRAQTRVSSRAATEKLLHRLKTRLLRAFGSRLVSVIIFGSEARGDARPDSDIDLMVVLEPPVELGRDLRRAIEAHYPLQLKLDRCIHTVIASRDAYEAGDYALYRNARTEGLAA